MYSLFFTFITFFKAPGQMKGQKEAVVILQEIKKIQLKYRRAQKEKRRRSRERRALAGLPPTTSDEDTSDEEIIPPVTKSFVLEYLTK